MQSEDETMKTINTMIVPYRSKPQMISKMTIILACTSIFFFILAWLSFQDGFIEFWHIPVSVLGIVYTVYLLRKIFSKSPQRMKRILGRQPLIVGGLLGLILLFVLAFQWQLTEEGLGQIHVDPVMLSFLGGLFGFLFIFTTFASISANFSRKVNQTLGSSMNVIGAQKFTITTLQRNKRRKRPKLRRK